MKFSVASLFVGFGMIAAPLISHAYYLHVFESLVTTALVTKGSVSFPEAPTTWYAASSITGLVLIILGFWLEFNAVRSKPRNDNVVA